MRTVRRSARWSAALLPLLLAVSPTSGPAGALEGDLTVDLHWLDAVQAADHATMSVTETYFFNNSGSSEFSGNVSFRIPEGAEVASKACGGDADTIARLAGASQTYCFPLQDLGGETRQGNPFNGTPMSYYGQRDVLTLRADSSLGDEANLAFNVTVGAAPDGEATPPPAAPGLLLATNGTEIGGFSPAGGGLPSNLTYVGNFTVYNNRTGAATVNLTANLGGAPWAATILDGTLPLASPFVLAANGSRELSVRVVVPNYLVRVQVDYTARMASAGDRRWSFPVDYLYPVEDAQYFLFLLESDNATGDAPQAGSFVLVHGGPTWQREMNRWWFFFIAEDLIAGARVDFRVFTEGGGDVLLLAAGLLAVLGAVALLGFALYRRERRRKAQAKGEGADGGVVARSPDTAAKPARTAGSGRSTSTAEVTRFREALQRVERDHEMGRLPRDSYESLKAKYEESIREVQAIDSESAELAELEERRNRVVRAIKNLRAELAAGSIDPEVARELEARYRDEAVALMKRRDGLRK